MALTTDVRYIGPNNRHMAKVNIMYVKIGEKGLRKFQKCF